MCSLQLSAVNDALSKVGCVLRLLQSAYQTIKILVEISGKFG
jgi:hypothetical protein